MECSESFSTGVELFTLHALLKSGLIMSNASPNANNPQEWDIKLYLTADTSTQKGRELLDWMKQLGVWFEA